MNKIFSLTVFALVVSLSTLGAQPSLSRGVFKKTPKTKVAFDVSKRTHVFEGMGVMVWQSGDSFKVQDQLQQIFGPSTNVCYARINHETRSSEPLPLEGTFEDYEAFWTAHGDAAAPDLGEGINFILLGTIPDEMKEPKGSGTKLAFHYCYDYVLYLAAGMKHFGEVNGIMPTHTEISNEPDGTWTAYIDPSDYDYIVHVLREVLDDHDMESVGIIGPGVAHLDWEDGDTWTNALSQESVSSLASWSVHAWIWADRVNKEGGQSAIRDYWPKWYVGAARQNPSLPVFVTEFAASANTFHHSTYANPSVNDPHSAAHTVPYGARVFSNAISLLSSGVNVPVYWQAADQSWGSGGTSLIDLSGNFTNMFTALYPLMTLLPIGAQGVETPDQGGDDIFATAFVKDNDVIVALANCSDDKRIKKVTLSGIDDQLRLGSVVATSYHQTTDVYSPILEDVSVKIKKVTKGEYEFSAELMKDSTLTLKASFMNDV